MATEFKEGDRVQILDREATAEDVKTSLFYNYFRGLTGVIQKVYTGDEAVIVVDQDSLAEPIARRHDEIQEQMKSKWLDGLSEEAKSRLSDQERDFRLSYTLLVSKQDLRDYKEDGEGRKSGGQIGNNEERPVAEAASRRATLEDLSAAEAAELQRRLEEKER